MNFLYGHPQWCVSVAVEDEQGSLAGVVLDAVRGELFAATRDGEATLDGRALPGDRAASAPRLEGALVGTGFGYASEVRAIQGELIARLLPAVRDVRRAGSAALDLAWAAAGRLDTYFERGTKPWDVAAGGLVCARAGLTVRELAATPELPEGIAVAPGALMDELWALIGPGG